MAFDGSRLQFYIDREREVREVAARCHDESVCRQLRRIADEYGKLAEQIRKGLLPSA